MPPRARPKRQRYDTKAGSEAPEHSATEPLETFIG